MRNMDFPWTTGLFVSFFLQVCVFSAKGHLVLSFFSFLLFLFDHSQVVLFVSSFGKVVSAAKGDTLGHPWTPFPLLPIILIFLLIASPCGFVWASLCLQRYGEFL